MAAVELQSPQGFDSALLTKVFATFDQHSCPVDVMATSLRRISLLAGSAAALPGIATALQGMADMYWETHKALVSLVGENIRRQPEVASRIFAAVSDMNLRVIFRGAPDRTISFLVEESNVEESVRRLHGLFFPKAEPARGDREGNSSALCQVG